MLSRMSAEEFDEWRAFDGSFPIGDLRVESEFARLRAFLAAMVAPKKKDLPPLQTFFWSYLTDERTQQKAKQKDLQSRILEAFGVKRNGH